jgi:hypothetical protein
MLLCLVARVAAAAWLLRCRLADQFGAQEPATADDRDRHAATRWTISTRLSASVECAQSVTGGTSVITEPEMWDESGAARPADVLSDADRPSSADGPSWRRRPWVWALGGIVASSAVWAALLNGTALGHDAGPDLHGYHLSASPCDGDILKPLTDAVHTRASASSPAKVSRGPALDETSCVLSAEALDGNGGTVTYTISVSVELHKKTDPRAEFENTDHVRISSLSGGTAYGSGLSGGTAYGSSLIAIGTSDSGLSASQVDPVSGLGDGAFLESQSPSDQILKVVHGGAVLSVGIDAFSSWNGTGDSPAGGPPQLDLAYLRPVLPVTMRHLMRALSV